MSFEHCAQNGFKAIRHQDIPLIVGMDGIGHQTGMAKNAAQDIRHVIGLLRFSQGIKFVLVLIPEQTAAHAYQDNRSPGLMHLINHGGKPLEGLVHGNFPEGIISA